MSDYPEKCGYVTPAVILMVNDQEEVEFRGRDKFVANNVTVENRKWGFQDEMDHFCRQNRSNPQSFLQSSLELNHNLSVYQMSQIIQLALM